MQHMGDETKRTEFEKGNTKPLDATRKPTAADEVRSDAPPTAQIPRSERELPNNDADDRPHSPPSGHSSSPRKR